ncbi:MAG TPA: 16S rRNA (cytidine(1402)-2'-O)-methyltransferase [Solimonas sp.]|nr:16S rRNA (cytidine(1402)-2'-O)-methyltransferase [Solimonas sp.]
MTRAAPVAPGHLYVVATPIGNLGDLSPRAREVLASVTRICAEDTRTTGVLLQHHGVQTPISALHDHNEDQLSAGQVQALRDGASLALVSDAGTPLISDPGFALVRAVRAAGLPVVAVPGPCAAVAALSISGLPTDAFVFAGFLPPKAQARETRLRELAGETRTLVLYEASHRITECVAAIGQVFGGDRVLCLARELTKLYEQSITAPAAEVLAWLGEDANRSRGEFVLVVAGAPAQPDRASIDSTRLLELLLAELPASKAARIAAQATGGRRNDLYALALKLGGKA